MILQSSTNSSSVSSSNRIFDISENLEDIQSAHNRLKTQLDRNIKLLTGHDSTAAALITDAVNDEMQCLVFKCRAYLMRIHSRVQQAKFAAVPYERRISQSKQGIHQFNESCKALYFSYATHTHYTDIRLREHTESSLAKRTPAIKQLAKKYNSLVEEAGQKATSFKFSQNLIPEPLDLTKLFDVEANPHMWMADMVPTNATELPAYLSDDNVRRGIASILVIDRVKEEVFRLQAEYQHLVKWLNDQISDLKSAIALCSGMMSPYTLLV
jgi:hypothetical protein